MFHIHRSSTSRITLAPALAPIASTTRTPAPDLARARTQEHTRAYARMSTHARTFAHSHARSPLAQTIAPALARRHRTQSCTLTHTLVDAATHSSTLTHTHTHAHLPIPPYKLHTGCT